MSDLELELTTPEDETVPTIMLIDEDGKEEAHQILSWMEYKLYRLGAAQGASVAL